MASDLSFVEFVVDQIKTEGNIRFKKMFGEYLIYVNDKPVVMVCDNTAFVKELPCVKPFLADAEKGCPYKGAKEHYIIDVDDSELLTTVVQELEKVVPIPKQKKKNK
jgi:TfoX/Sxy family transcriptional regulator of competence genes